MPDTWTAQQAAAVAAAGAALGLLSLLVALFALRALRRVRRATEALTGGRGGDDLVAVLTRQADDLRALAGRVETLDAGLRAARGEASRAVRHVAVVRYDAFADMGGRMSFSAALVDDHGDGLVLTSINGRSETRTYAKGLVGGASEQPLSPEEQDVVAHARAGTGSVPAGPRPAARRAAGRSRFART